MSFCCCVTFRPLTAMCSRQVGDIDDVKAKAEQLAKEMAA